MSIWIYLLCTYLLSVAGLLVYSGLRSRYSFKQRKLILASIIGMSLLLPAGTNYLFPAANVQAIQNGQALLDNPPSPQVKDLELAQNLLVVDPTSGDTRINEHNVSIFHENATYNWFIAHKSELRTSALWGMKLMLVLFGLQFSYLLWLRFTGVVKKTMVDGREWNLLYRDGGKTGFGSFRLFNGYILWSHDYDHLPEYEKQAVLQHEISHLRQNNTWELIGLDLLRLVWFANPALYYLRAEWKKLSEFIADADAIEHVGDSAAYAKILLDYSTDRQGLKPAYLAAFGSHPLRERIGQMANKATHSAKLWPMVLGLGLVLSIGSAFSTPTAQQKEMDFYVYEMCYCINMATGQLIFCDDCLTEGLDCACIE